MSKRFPDWDVDKARGEEAEALFREVRRGVMLGTTEVKCDDRARDTGNLYFELACKTANGWKPSGLNDTKAANWCQVVGHAGLFMPVWALRSIVKAVGSPKECLKGSHPTKGRTVRLDRLFVEYVQLINRVDDYRGQEEEKAA